MATITATGAWTPIGVDFTQMAPGAGSPTFAPGNNVTYAARQQLEVLKGAPYPELDQFVAAMAAGYGIGYNNAKALLNSIWQSFMNRETPMVTGGTSRVYG